MLSDGRALDLGGQKQRTVLALLLLDANRVVSISRLIDAIWGEQPTASAQKAVQVYVSQLRKLLGRERLQTKAPGYLLQVEPDELDLASFERLQEEGRLDDALSLWRGRPLAEFADRPFALAEIARLQELRLVCVEERIDQDLARGRHTAVVGELEAAIKEQPLRERLRGQLVLALYRSGRQADALAAYQDARRVLVEELGIEPGRALRELQQAILRQDGSLDRAPDSAPEGDAGGGVFVGRERELAELLRGLEDALGGSGRLFLLAGEPGIGKSRLAEELVVRAKARGARVLVGRCWEAGGAPAYWPWVQSLRSYVREADREELRAQLGSGATELAQILPELRELLPRLPEPSSLESESARFRLFDATAEFLRKASAGRPIVLVLDDLHAADAPSLLLLQFVARGLASTHMLVVGAFRDLDPAPSGPLTALLAELAREPVTRRLSLGGLSDRDVARYLELSSSPIASAELVATLHEETDGNPLFVTETVRLLIEEGAHSEPDAVVRIAFPQSVRDVIARRLAHLSDECNRVLVLAAVLGREFALTALARLSGSSEDQLLETLDEAMTVRVISDSPDSPGRLRFAHVLIRDTLYGELTTARRVRLHRQAVSALEELYGPSPGSHLAELAHHAVAGRDFDKGLRYAQDAGDRAIVLLAYEEASRLYSSALDALDSTAARDETLRCELLASLGDAEARAGNVPAAKEAFLEAFDIAHRLGRPHDLARAAVGYGGRIVLSRAGDDPRLVPMLGEAVAALADGDEALRARLLSRLAGALRDEPARERRDRLSREAVELARSGGDAATLAYALDGRISAIVAADTVAECVALSGELCEVAALIGDRERLVAGHCHRLNAQLQIGNLGKAQDDLETANRIADELAQPAQLWQARAARAMLALAAGRLAEGEELAREAFVLGERAQSDLAIPAYRLQRYAICAFRGTLEEIEPEIRALVAEFPARLAFRCVLSHLLAAIGQRSEARELLEDLGRDDYSNLPFDQEWLYGMSLLAETAVLLDDTDSAGAMHRLLSPWAALNVSDEPEGFRGSVSRYLGLLAATMKLPDEAAGHFETALEMNERMGALPWLAHAQVDYAELLVTSGGPGRRVDELLARALATYRELGMASYATATVALAGRERPSIPNKA